MYVTLRSETKNCVTHSPVSIMKMCMYTSISLEPKSYWSDIDGPKSWLHTQWVAFRENCELRVGEGNGTPLQYSCLENPMDGAWKAAVLGVAEGRTQMSDFTFTFHFHALEKEMATHSSVLARRIPGKGEPGGLLSIGSHRVGHDWSDVAAADY